MMLLFGIVAVLLSLAVYYFIKSTTDNSNMQRLLNSVVIHMRFVDVSHDVSHAIAVRDNAIHAINEHATFISAFDRMSITLAAILHDVDDS